MSALATGLRDWASGRMPPVERAWRVVDRLRAHVELWGCEVGRNVLVGGPLDLALHGHASIGARSAFLTGPVPTSVHVARGARLEIGQACHFNYGVSISVEREVRIGARCMFGSYVLLDDTVHGSSKPILIGDDVWLAHGVVIEPGVTIGNGAVISAGAVVTTDVPAGMVALGNPARVMSQQLTGRPT